jgi:hypothetical protein
MGCILKISESSLSRKNPLWVALIKKTHQKNKKITMG